MSRDNPGYFAPSRVNSRGIVGGPGSEIPGYATQWPGQSFGPGSAGSQPNERTRMSLLDLVYENWLPFTAWITSRFIRPRVPTAPWQSPFDLDNSERITRFGSFPSSERPFPYPYMIGAVSGFMPMLDQYSMQWAWGKTPSGPGVATPIPVPWMITYPDLMKVTG